jgi:hypothetical protein
MPVEDNKQAVGRFYELSLTPRTWTPLDELLVPDGVDHTFGSENAEQANQFFGHGPPGPSRPARRGPRRHHRGEPVAAR